MLRHTAEDVPLARTVIEGEMYVKVSDLAAFLTKCADSFHYVFMKYQGVDAGNADTAWGAHYFCKNLAEDLTLEAISEVSKEVSEE